MREREILKNWNPPARMAGFQIRSFSGFQLVAVVSNWLMGVMLEIWNGQFHRGEPSISVGTCDILAALSVMSSGSNSSGISVSVAAAVANNR